MAKVIDFRRAHDNWASLADRRCSERKRRAESRVSTLLPFVKQISVGISFRVIIGNIDLDERPDTAEGHRVIGPRFDVTKRLIGDLRSNSPRAKHGDVLLTLVRERTVEELAAAMVGLGPRSEARIRPEKRASKFRVGGDYREVGPDLDGCLLARGVIALRSKNRSVPAQELTRFLLLYRKLRYFADDVADWPIIGVRGDAVRDVVQRLRAASIPVVPADLIECLDDAFIAEQEEFNSKPHLTELLRSRSQIEMYRSLARLSARTYALRQAIDECGSLPYLIRNFYPYPLAFRYRAIQTFAHPAERLREQVAFVEGILAFLASVALKLIEPAPGVLVGEGRKFVRFSCGDWLAAFKGATKRLAPSNRLDLSDALGLLSLRKFEKLEALVNARNKEAHRPAPTQFLGEEEKRLEKLIEDCLEELAFFVRFRLFRILDALRTDRRTNSIVHEVEYYGGSDPVHERNEADFGATYQGGLYILTGLGAEELFPFVTVRRCTSCHRDETFFLDSQKDRRTWRVKSFEYGHILEVTDLTDELSKWL